MMKTIVEVKRVCEGACMCTGACNKPLSQEEKLRALHTALMNVQAENRLSRVKLESVGDNDGFWELGA